MSFDLNAARERVANQVKLDIISKTQALENAAKFKEISRTFICESDKLYTYLKLKQEIQRTLSQVPYRFLGLDPTC